MSKTKVYDMLRTTCDENVAITHEQIMEIMGYILDRESELQNDMAKWLDNCNMLVKRVGNLEEEIKEKDYRILELTKRYKALSRDE